MEATYRRKTQVSAAVTDDTYNEVLREAARRGVTVSELVRYYVEEGLNNPIPRELRALNERISTMEGALKELYEMAVMNWAQVQKEEPKPKLAAPLPWMPEAFNEWKKQLSERGVVSEEGGKLAYEALGQKVEQKEFLGAWEEDEEDIQAELRSMWINDGSWTSDEERKYQERVKLVAEQKQEKLRESAGLPAKRRPYNKKKKRGRPRRS